MAVPLQGLALPDVSSTSLHPSFDEAGRYFDPLLPIDILSGNLPHWRQEGAMYFVTFRLADSIPTEKLRLWVEERNDWRERHPYPLNSDEQQEYRRLFSARLEYWLDQGHGSCILAVPEYRKIVTTALRHFDGQRYALGEFVVAANHVHVIVTPTNGYTLSSILHSWKSFTSHEIVKAEAFSGRSQPTLAARVEAPSGRLQSKRPPAARDDVRNDTRDHVQPDLPGDFRPDVRDGVREAIRGKTNPSRTTTHTSQRSHTPWDMRSHRIWQKEYYDHLVRGPGALARIEEYIRRHREWAPQE